jgi:hypothetical protein
MLSDIVTAINILSEIYNIYEQLKEDQILFRRLCERVQLFTKFLQELQTNCAYPNYKPTDPGTDSLEGNIIQLTSLLSEIKDFLTKHSESNKSFYGSFKRIIITASFRNKFTNNLNSLNQRINGCVCNLLPSLGINFEEQNRLDTESLKNQIDVVADDVVNQLIQLNFQGNSSKIMELLTDIKSNSDDMESEIMGQILALEKKISSSKTLTLRDIVKLEDLLYKEKETLKAFLDDKLAEYNNQIQLGLHKVEEKIDEVLYKILNEINLSKDEKQKRQELLGQVIIPPPSARVEVKETVLGMGGFGTVFLGIYGATKVALKSLNSANGREMESVENEVLLMNYLGSQPNILTCYGIWKDTRGHTFVVLDYSPFGSLVEILSDFTNFPEISIRLQIGWVIDLINAISFIHQRNVKHRDIKADNLLVFSGLTVKLCDFGLNKKHSQSTVSSVFGGTHGFMAPAVVTGKGSGFPSDVFSWAMTFYQIVMRKCPQVNLSHSQLVGNLLVELEDKLDGVELGLLASLLANCIHKNPEERPLACDINELMLRFLGDIGGDPRLGIRTGDDEMINELEGQLKKRKKIHKAAEMKKATEFTGVRERTLEGHSDAVRCLVKLADGRVVSGSWGKTLKVWNVNTGVCEKTLNGHRHSVNCLAQLADGRVVSGSFDNTLKVWNVNTGVCERTLEGHRDCVNCLVQLANGRVVSGSHDKTLRVWNANTGVCEKTLQGHRDRVRCLVMLADGRVVSCSDDNTLRVWNVNKGVCERTLEGHRSYDRCLVELADGRVVSGSHNYTLQVWNVNTGVCEGTLNGHCSPVLCLVKLADGRVVSGSWDRTLKVWNVNTGVCEKTLKGHRNAVYCLAQLADGRVVSGSFDKTLKVWNVNTGVCEKTLEGHRDCLNCLVQLADGRVVSGSADKTLRVWK